YHMCFVTCIVALFVFFFQAEDGIRDFHVTGVQTCALPISGGRPAGRHGRSRRGGWQRARWSPGADGWSQPEISAVPPVLLRGSGPVAGGEHAHARGAARSGRGTLRRRRGACGCASPTP